MTSPVDVVIEMLPALFSLAAIPVSPYRAPADIVADAATLMVTLPDPGLNEYAAMPYWAPVTVVLASSVNVTLPLPQLYAIMPQPAEAVTLAKLSMLTAPLTLVFGTPVLPG